MSGRTPHLICHQVCRASLGNPPLSLVQMSARQISKQMRGKGVRRAPLSNRWWVWGGLLASVMLMLLGNFLLVRKSLHSLEHANARAKASFVAKEDVQATMVNIVLLEDASDANDGSTLDQDTTTVSASEGDLIIQSTSMTRDLEQSLGPERNTGQAQGKTPRSAVSLMEDGGNAVTATNTMAQGGFNALTATGAPPSEIDEPADTSKAPARDTEMHSEDEDNHEGDTTTGHLPAPPQRWPPLKGSQEECLYLQDYGLLERLRTLSSSFCTTGSSPSPYTLYEVPSAEFNATTLENFVLDMRGAHISQDISSVAQDGGGHDPRFKRTPNLAFCNCSDPQDAAHGAPDMWMHTLAEAKDASQNDPICQSAPSERPSDVLSLERAVILTRKDDHNPFFQISGILNAWIMMKVLGWENTSTQLVTLDRALPSPVDELRHAVLAPDRPIVSGEELQKRVVHLASALLSPVEFKGPLMSHLDDDQLCFANAMVADFRDQALQSMNVDPHKTDPRRCLVTVISRRPYGGRRIQRVWRNEEGVLNRTRDEYKNAYQFGECAFQALDFVDMTMRDQMRAMVDSDVVIGMHGAGMVNVMWTRPGTLVVEVFPRRRRRWGFRNLCQYLGCSWHDFRGGQDLFVRTTDPNDMDKIVPYDEWKGFFDPLFRDAIARLEQEVEAGSLLGDDS
jgi:glycoprotein 2-beta-D-xylosyltransferase